MSEAPSPFLPGTQVQVAWDSTSLSYLKTCPRLYYYHMIEGWSSREESVHLRFGIEYHNALQNYDLSRAAGITHADAVHDVLREALISSADFESDHKTKTRESLLRTIVWYLDAHQNDKAETFILADGKPAVEQSFRFELDYGPQSQQEPENIGNPDHRLRYLLCGHLDKIVTFQGDLYVKDYKTVWSFWGKHWEPDNQMTLYTLTSKVILHTPVRGVMIDMAQIKADGTTEFRRDFTFRTPDQLEEWLADLRYWLTLAEQYALTQHWPMNDTACDKFGGCRFRDICSKSPSVRERFLKGNFVKLEEKDRWNPLRSR